MLIEIPDKFPVELLAAALAGVGLAIDAKHDRDGIVRTHPILTPSPRGCDADGCTRSAVIATSGSYWCPRHGLEHRLTEPAS